MNGVLPTSKQSYSNMSKCGLNLTVEYPVSSREDWFDSRRPLQLVTLKSSTAMKFRKMFLRGFLRPGSCNLYIGLLNDKKLIGVYGFQNPDYGTYDLIMKADTSVPVPKLPVLLLMILKTQKMKVMLERKFNRDINSILTKIFSKYPQSNRYRKTAKLVTKKEVEGGYDLSYLITTGKYKTVKQAVSEWRQKYESNTKAN